jgi:hypothetical protein
MSRASYERDLSIRESPFGTASATKAMKVNVIVELDYFEQLARDDGTSLFPFTEAVA